MKVNVDLEVAYRLLHPRNTVLVSCIDRSGKANILAIAWCMPVSTKPPLVAVSISPKRYSHTLIEETGEFVINIPTMEILKETLYCGRVSGRKVDKFKHSGLTSVESKVVKPPAIKECVAHLECKLYKKVPAGDHTIFIGEVVASYAKEGTFEESFDIKKVKLIYHIAGDRFTTTSEDAVTPS
ncbi:flavin reductase family protein [Candidatus Bathyarchaeota archaeon]|nr:flavin reductase family protein [Candidatus Bathyarchaeota archaeon]